MTKKRSELQKTHELRNNQVLAIDAIELEEELQMELLESNDYLTDNIHDCGVAYIACLVEHRLTDSEYIYCDLCRNVLANNEKCDDKICVNVRARKPCLSTYQLCKLADTAIKILINTGPKFYHKVYLMVMNNVNWENIFPEFYEPDHDIEHKHFLVKFIIDGYVKKKCTFIAKQKTIELQKKYIRNSLRKTAHELHL